MNFLNLDPGTIVIAVIILLFYLRLAMLRGRKRKLARQEALARKRSGGGKKKPSQLEAFGDRNQPSYQVTSWWLMGAAIFLMLLGVAINNSKYLPLPAAWQPYWWIVTGVGGILFIFCFK